MPFEGITKMVGNWTLETFLLFFEFFLGKKMLSATSMKGITPAAPDTVLHSFAVPWNEGHYR